MQKKPFLRTLMHSEHVKGFERLLMSAPQYFSDIFWSMSQTASSKYCVLVVSEILRCLLTYWHPMTSILSQEERVLHATNSKAIISKSKNIFWIFFCISEIYIKFGILCSKRWDSELICFWNYILQKAGLLKWLKCRVAEYLWTVNMLKALKDCIGLYGSIFVIFVIDHSERKSSRKNNFF